ncbi:MULTISPECIES: helix-turn-helix transcriptional regulator [unclassified Microbacterium]|uniref:helix-turn-helix transcriptional regulator n=1 Tax=unclassified Microbacterium TaxID=2609290 RepID=UPI001604F6E4|nr:MULTISPECIES: helix-turn-helix transcriptional regulator [unclassified Microbacterium]QNA91868.1 helix-turn-helix domain-containing protein [Microbacterium sp. Se63.02b]QYM65090.1 helix-turn-helix transcriptional regulator [Microbacterium sp. Se5.02b]
MDTPSSNRDDIRDFLVSRRGRLTPEQVGLPSGTRRRVPGLRREEVAVLSGVSTEWYTRLEKGHISGVSEEVLTAVARALHLDDDERAYLFDLAKAARPTIRRAPRPRDGAIQGPVQWLIDSVGMSAVFLRNGRLDVLATNALARALHAPLFDSPTVVGGRANFARFHFLDPDARDFFVDWEGGASATVALLRAEAGREPDDRALRELIGELSTSSRDFTRLWSSHEVRTRHEGLKVLQHPVVGSIELTYQSAELADRTRAARTLNLYTAEPGTPHEDRLKLLSSWAAADVADRDSVTP